MTKVACSNWQYLILSLTLTPQHNSHLFHSILLVSCEEIEKKAVKADLTLDRSFVPWPNPVSVTELIYLIQDWNPKSIQIRAYKINNHILINKSFFLRKPELSELKTTILPEIKIHNSLLLLLAFPRDCSGKVLLTVKPHCQCSVLMCLDLAVALDTVEHCLPSWTSRLPLQKEEHDQRCLCSFLLRTSATS